MIYVEKQQFIFFIYKLPSLLEKHTWPNINLLHDVMTLYIKNVFHSEIFYHNIHGFFR